MDDDRRAPRVAVVGAGIGGLACARALLVQRPGLEVTVFEGSPRVGGKLALGEVAGITVDLGAESMLNRRPEGTELARAVGLAESVVHPAVSGAGVWSGHRIRPLPQTVMGIPVRLADAAESGLISASGTALAGLESQLPVLDVSEDVGFGTMVAQRLGPEIRDRLVEPLLGGVYAGRSDEISMYAAVPQLVDAVRQQGSLLAAARALSPGAASGLPAAGPAVFAGISGGIGRLPEAVARDITRRGGRVILDATVRQLIREPAGWRVTRGPTVAAVSEVFDAVVIAVPGAPAARLLQVGAPAAARELRAVEYASMAVVTLAYGSDQVGVELSGTGFLVPPVDGHVIKAATYSSQKWAWLSGAVTIVRCSIGRHREETILQRGDDDLIEVARLDIRGATGLAAPVVDARVTRWGGALPQYAVGHLDRVRRLRTALGEVAGVEVCGALYDGVGIPAVVAGGQAAATRLLAYLDAPGTMGP